MMENLTLFAVFIRTISASSIQYLVFSMKYFVDSILLIPA